VIHEISNDSRQFGDKPSGARVEKDRRGRTEIRRVKRGRIAPPWRWHKERVEKWSGRRAGIRTRIRKRIKITDLGHIFAVEMVCQ